MWGVGTQCYTSTVQRSSPQPRTTVMDDLKKLAGGASTLFNRAVQYTGEKLGSYEHTSFDAHFEQLMQRCDILKHQTERLIKTTEAVLQPDPTQRAEDMLYGTLNKSGFDTRHPTRMSPLAILGTAMLEAAAALGPGSTYGNTLLKVGQVEQNMAQCEKNFVHSALREYLNPLQAFLDGEMKRIAAERRVLETKRLDLDAAKGKMKRAKNEQSKTNSKMTPEQIQAESDLRTAQSEFDRQAELTKLLLEGLSSANNHHNRLLIDLVEMQASYYANCHHYTQELLRQLGSNATIVSRVGASTNNVPTRLTTTATPPPRPNTKPASEGFASLAEPPTQRAKVLYDYTKNSEDELDLVADEEIDVWPTNDSSWLMAQKGNQQGRVPMTYLEIIRSS